MDEERRLSREESCELGRVEYLNPENAGKSSLQVYNEKFVKNGVSHIWRSEFIAGWHCATMLDDDQVRKMQQEASFARHRRLRPDRTPFGVYLTEAWGAPESEE